MRTPLQLLRQKRNAALRQADAAEARAAKLRQRASDLNAQIMALGAPLYGSNVPRLPRSPLGSSKLAADLIRAHGYVTSPMLGDALANAMGIAPCYALRQRAVHVLRAMWKRGGLSVDHCDGLKRYRPNSR